MQLRGLVIYSYDIHSFLAHVVEELTSRIKCLASTADGVVWRYVAVINVHQICSMHKCVEFVTFCPEAYNGAVEFNKTLMFITVAGTTQWADWVRGISSNQEIESFRQSRELTVSLQIHILAARILLSAILSHTRTVVRECSKGDDASQWENGKFDPLPPPNPLTDRHKKLRSWLGPGYLPTCKI